MSSKKQALFISSLVILWYTANIGVLLLNKFLLSNYGFRFPIFLTMCHMSACAVLSYISIAFLKLVPLQAIKSRSQFLKIATLSVVFCASVVGGNISLRYLAVSFNQAVGATTPFFTALFAFLMTFKREAWVTYAALVPVVTGVVIASGVCLFFWLLGQFCSRLIDFFEFHYYLLVSIVSVYKCGSVLLSVLFVIVFGSETFSILVWQLRFWLCHKCQSRSGIQLHGLATDSLCTFHNL